MILYIAGSITHGGTVTDETEIRANLQAFHDAQRRLEDAGHVVLNPARHSGDLSKTWQDYMRLGLADVIAADGLAMLPDWSRSSGAKLEADVAFRLGLPVDMVEAWIRKGGA